MIALSWWLWQLWLWTWFKIIISPKICFLIYLQFFHCATEKIMTTQMTTWNLHDMILPRNEVGTSSITSLDFVECKTLWEIEHESIQHQALKSGIIIALTWSNSVQNHSFLWIIASKHDKIFFFITLKVIRSEWRLPAANFCGWNALVPLKPWIPPYQLYF